MSEGASLTRRAALGPLAASLLVAAKPVAAASFADSPLLALGRDFDVVAARLDHAIAAGIDIDDGLLEQLSKLDAEIATTQASTMEGLFVKARAACWARLGDLDDFGEMTTDQRMALSMVRDLIRLFDPALERPGALAKLVEDNERGAGNSASREASAG